MIIDPRKRSLPLYAWLLLRHNTAEAWTALARFRRRPLVRMAALLAAESIVALGFVLLTLYALAGRS